MKSILHLFGTSPKHSRGSVTNKPAQPDIYILRVSRAVMFVVITQNPFDFPSAGHMIQARASHLKIQQPDKSKTSFSPGKT